MKIIKSYQPLIQNEFDGADSNENKTVNTIVQVKNSSNNKTMGKKPKTTNTKSFFKNQFKLSNKTGYECLESTEKSPIRLKMSDVGKSVLEGDFKNVYKLKGKKREHIVLFDGKTFSYEQVKDEFKNLKDLKDRYNLSSVVVHDLCEVIKKDNSKQYGYTMDKVTSTEEFKLYDADDEHYDKAIEKINHNTVHDIELIIDMLKQNPDKYLHGLQFFIEEHGHIKIKDTFIMNNKTTENTDQLSDLNNLLLSRS